MAPVKIDKKWGYINKNGKIIIEPQFDNAYRFFGFHAQVTIMDYKSYVINGTIMDGKLYKINRSGKILLDPICSLYQ